MLNGISQRIAMRQNERLKQENEDLKKEIEKLRDKLFLYDEKIQAVDEKEKRYDQLLTAVEKQRIELNKLIELTKQTKGKMEKSYKQVKKM